MASSRRRKRLSPSCLARRLGVPWPTRSEAFELGGGYLWDLAFLLAVSRTYRRREPVWSRGGRIGPRSNPVTHRFLFLLLFVLGMAPLVVLTLLLLLSRL